MSGWARNTPEGTVEAVFEGDAEAVEGMLDFVRGGPGHAEVSPVEVHRGGPRGSAGLRHPMVRTFEFARAYTAGQFRSEEMPR